MNPTLPFGFQYPTPDTDSAYGRALSGVWALDGSRLLVAPWIQSDESVVIEWAGAKGSWAPTDLVPDDVTFEDAVTFYVQMCYERDFGCNPERMAIYKAEHVTANADLLWNCREQTQVRVTPRTAAEGQAAWVAHRAGETAMAPAPPATSNAPVVVAFIADYGSSTASATNPAAVARQIKSWNPAAIVAGGDHNYPSGGAATIDLNIGGLYRNFIFPYTGAQPLWPGETDATVNKFWPALGNHDWDGTNPPTPGKPYFDYFTGVLPNNNRIGAPGEPRFYEIVLGPMHFFILNSGYDSAKVIHEPMSIEGAGLQATWLQERAALSTAPFKIAVLHHAPYTSVSNYAPGHPMLQWNFELMGIDLVLSGHAHMYERLLKAVGPGAQGIPYLVCGASGTDLVASGPPVAGSLVRIDDALGAVRLTADCTMLTAEFVDTAGAVLDSVTINA